MNEFVIKNYIDTEDRISNDVSDISTIYEIESKLINKYERIKKRLFNDINIILLGSIEEEKYHILSKIQDMLNKKQIRQNNF